VISAHSRSRSCLRGLASHLGSGSVSSFTIPIILSCRGDQAGSNYKRVNVQLGTKVKAMSEPVHFEVRELGTGTNSANTKGNKQYMGVERRRNHRRRIVDRRTEVRFEPTKDDRRKDRGRRHDDISGHMF
jgi:hypothetical protein